jgi:hypothetical protein
MRLVTKSGRLAYDAIEELLACHVSAGAPCARGGDGHHFLVPPTAGEQLAQMSAGLKQRHDGRSTLPCKWPMHPEVRA